MAQLQTPMRNVRRAVVTGLAFASLLAPGLNVLMPETALARQDAADLPVTAQAAPEDTMFFLSMDLDTESAQWQQVDTLLGRVGAPGVDQLLNEIPESDDPSMGSREDVQNLLGGELGVVIQPKALENLIAVAEQYQGTSEDDMDAMQTAMMDDFAAMQEGGFGVSVILEPGNPDAAWSFVEEQIQQAADDAGKTVETVDYNGTEILSMPMDDMSTMATPDAMTDDAVEIDGTPAADDKMGGAMMDLGGEYGMHPQPSGAIARVGDFIAAAGTPADLEAVIDAAGDGPSLADGEAFQEARGQFANDAVLFTYASNPAIRSALPEDLITKTNEFYAAYYPDVDPEPYWNSYATSVVWADDPGFRIDAVSFLPGGELPAMATGDDFSDFANNVSADTIVYSTTAVPQNRLAIFAGSLAQSINSVMDPESAPAPENFDDFVSMIDPAYYEAQVEQASEFLGFNLNTDLFDHLTGQFGLAIGGIEFTSGVNVDALLVAPASDAEALAPTLEKVARLVQKFGGESIEITPATDGDNITYTVSDSSGGVGVPAVQFGIQDGELVIGTESGLTAYADGPTDTLADDPEFQEVMGLLPEGGYHETYVNVGWIADLAMQFMGTGDSAMAMTDADPACSEYGDVAEAQAAFDADPLANSNLDSDFDGQACEDFYTTASAVATPAAPTGSVTAIRGLGLVGYEADGKQGASVLLWIPEAGE